MVFSRMVKETRSFVVLSALLGILFTFANASMGDFIRNQLNGSLEITSPGYYKTQAGGFWYGGGLRLRWDMSGANINLFHAEAPHFAVGCNGVDMTFGSFSYLGFDQLVEKLKKIAAAAPAMAFQMAIMTLCEQCNTIMTNLEKIADALNNFNLNACQATKALAGKGASIIANFLSSSGATEDASSTRVKVKTDTTWAITTAIQQAANMFGGIAGAEGMKNKLGYGSLVDKLTERFTPAVMNVAEFKAIMRAITGDIYGYDVSNSDSSGVVHENPSKVDIITPLEVDGSNFIKVLVYGGDLKVLVLNPNVDGDIYKPISNYKQNVDFLTVSTEPNLYAVANLKVSKEDSIYNFVKTNIDNILNKLKTKQSFTNSEIDFINAMPLPVYKMLNLVATLGLDSNSLEEVRRYLSYRILESFIDEYFRQINKTINYLSADKDLSTTYSRENLNRWKKMAYHNIREIKKVIDKRIYEAEQKVNVQRNLINKFADLEKEMYKNSPIWSANAL